MGWRTYFTLVVAMGWAFLSTACAGTRSTDMARAASPVTLEAAGEREMLRATVQITMVGQTKQIRHEYVNQDGQLIREWVVRQERSPGIGTLVRQDGNVYLVTHNHWPQLGAGGRLDFVEFADSEGQQILVLAGAKIRPDILYQDAGTLVLRPPQRLLAQLGVSDGIANAAVVVVGEVVMVARRQPQSNQQVTLVQAQVTATPTADGVVQIEMRSLDGSSIEPGDSGGGIWIEGRLVGNLWSTVREDVIESKSQKLVGTRATDRSTGAGLIPARMLTRDEAVAESSCASLDGVCLQ